MNVEALISAVFGLIGGFWFGATLVDEFGVRPLKKKAIALGFAYWEVDDETGITKFTWKEKP